MASLVCQVNVVCLVKWDRSEPAGLPGVPGEPGTVWGNLKLARLGRKVLMARMVHLANCPR